MAASEEKQFDPTPRRLEQAREQGQGAVSPDLFAGVVLIAGLVGLSTAAQEIGSGFYHELRNLATSGLTKDFTPTHVQGLLTGVIRRGIDMTAGLVVMVAAATLLVGFMQSGFRFSPGVLAIQWGRLTQGWDRLASLGNLSRVA